MKYTLTRANPDADQYPLQERQIVTDPLEEEVNKNVFMTRLEDVMHTAVNWGRKNSVWPFNFGTSCCYVVCKAAKAKVCMRCHLMPGLFMLTASNG